MKHNIFGYVLEKGRDYYMNDDIVEGDLEAPFCEVPYGHCHGR
jgi:hypothetical protein